MNKRRIERLTLYHDVSRLGAGVAKGASGMIRRYADLASLEHLPLITLSGKQFAKPWSEIVETEGCSGNAAPSEEGLKRAATGTNVFFLWFLIFLRHAERVTLRPSKAL